VELQRPHPFAPLMPSQVLNRLRRREGAGRFLGSAGSRSGLQGFLAISSVLTGRESCSRVEGAHEFESCPALRSVLSKVAVFAIFVAQFLRNKPSAPDDKSTARSAL